MTLINIQSLGVTLSDPLFKNLTFTISKGDRIGLVAANGQGKSTLIGCLAGSWESTSGEITRARGLRVGHVNQTFRPRHCPARSMIGCYQSFRKIRPTMKAGELMMSWMNSVFPPNCSKNP